MNLDELFKIIDDGWDFNSVAYPLKNRDTKTGEDNFAINHILLHIIQIMGNMAKIIEHSDHQISLFPKELAKDPGLLIINAIKLAQVTGVTPEQIEQQIIDWQNRHS